MDGKQYEPGLYQFDGTEFRKLEPSGEVKVSVSDEAMEAVKAVRKAAQGVIKMRPELSIVASAMILEASKMPAIAESVAAYGLSIYTSGVKHMTGDDTQQQHQEVPAQPVGQSVSSYVTD